MRTSFKRILSFALALALCLAVLPAVSGTVQAATVNYSVSSAYASSPYYTALCGVTLTGNQREDIINVALSQVGYREGDYTGDYSGADDGSYNNYTEYNYWYHNNVSADMPVGGSWAPWCATFVSWCARRANIPTSVMQNSTVAGRRSNGFNVVFYSGSSTLASSSDNDSYFMGYNYTPKKGDLFFTRSWSHVGLVISSDGTTVTTVEGNTNNDGSADGFGVFVRTRYVDDLYFGVPDYAESYASSACTYYPAHCQITINRSTPVNSQPCSVSTEYDSSNLGTAMMGQTLTATGLYLNSYGNYWYRVDMSGETGYLYAGDTRYVEQITSDITLTDYDVPEGHVQGNSFTVNGIIASEYNRLETAACHIYAGFDPEGDALTDSSDTVGGNRYNLDGSDVDYDIKFGSLECGNHTYELTVSYINYYATGSTTISSNTGTICLLLEYFVVIPSAVDQSSCGHAYTTTTVGASVCTEGGTQIKACSLCGEVTKSAIAAGGHAFGSWNTVSDATCSTSGSQTRTCSACGRVETRTTEPYGHDYDTVIRPATCKTYASYTFTCGICGDQYTLTADDMAETWMEFIPGSMDESLFNTQIRYRYSDYQTTTSTSNSLSGYTQTGSQWVESGSGSIRYVPDWPSGFSTSHSTYTQYNKAGSKVTPSETDSTRTVVASDGCCGYLYYHWCYDDSYYSASASSGSYTTFHAYYDTTDPDSYTCDTSDMSYKTSSSNCSNSDWWFVTEVHQQDYTNYTKQYTYERWTDFSSWSTIPVTASATRKVEIQTVYQLKSAELGDHTYVNGTCSVCGATGTGSTQSTDYYLFGYINGANYGCEEDAASLGSYKFVNGKLTVTFQSDSYVAVKTGSQTMYMTSGWLGTSATAATLYPAQNLSNADKLYVPGGCAVTFTLQVNSDNTLSLSYVAAQSAVVPTLTPKYPSLAFEDEIRYNIYYTVDDPSAIVEMGLAVYSYRNTAGTVGNAVAVVPGHMVNADGSYTVSTNGIPAKQLGDALYMKVYAKLTDGTYAYSDIIGYHAVAYAKTVLNSSASTTQAKALMVAMLNYGAAAQVQFDYNTDNLMNSFLSADAQSLVKPYESGMLSPVVSADSAKAGHFVMDKTAFTSIYPKVSFEGAFAINYYFVNSLTPDNGITFCYWDAETYDSVNILTTSNATGKVVMTQEGDSWRATVDGIAAKDIDRTVYVAAMYHSGGTLHTTSVIAYSLGTYCQSVAANGNAFGAATAVYGYYAKAYFAN